jgi:hypothetical protein
MIFMSIIVDVQGQKVNRQTAINAFSQKNYELAYSQFKELSATYPGDPLYKYYCGVCLVEEGREPSKASSLLNEAAYESGAIRSVPPDCFFYLGRALQMSGKFQEAIQAYDRFAGQAGKKSSREMNVPDLIKQCNEQKGKIAVEETNVTEKTVKDTVAPDITRPSAASDSSGKTGGLKKGIDSLPVEYDKLLGQALESRIKADSMAGIGDHKTHQAVAETDSVALKMKAAATGNSYITVVSQKDTTADVIKSAVKDASVFSEFSVDEEQVFKRDEKVTVDPDVPPGLIYRIQVAVFRNPVILSYFKGIRPVQGFRNPSSGITTYYAGRFRKSADAGYSLLKVRSLGFRDAFVVALMDKKIVSTDRATALEKEWGSKPLFTTAPSPVGSVRDTVPPTLVFRVEVKRSQKPLPEDQVEVIRKMAGNKGLDIVSPEPKQYIYLIGKFLSFSSATEFTDLLLRNGFRDAKVVAWLGKREIPVETAKQLFDQQ